jgi:hypothetical protein
MASGAAFACAALLRLFPALIIGGLLLNLWLRSWHARRLDLTPGDRSFAFGALAATVLLVPLSFFVVSGSVRGGLETWTAFVANTRKHLDTPLTNNVGLAAVVTFDPSSEGAQLGEYALDVPWDTWQIARRRLLIERRPILLVCIAAYLALLALAVRRREPWTCLVLGVGLIPIATQLTSYYYSVLLLYGLLLPLSALSVLMLTAVAAASLLVPSLFGEADTAFTVVSLMVVLLVTAITAVFAADRSASARGEPVV